MARTYLVFGDVEGKLDVLRVARGPLPTQGLLSRPQANGKIRTQRQHDEMEAAAQRKEPVTLKRGDSIGIAITAEQLRRRDQQVPRLWFGRRYGDCRSSRTAFREPSDTTPIFVSLEHDITTLPSRGLRVLRARWAAMFKDGPVTLQYSP
jgi:hypothetical protein